MANCWKNRNRDKQKAYLRYSEGCINQCDQMAIEIWPFRTFENLP